MSCLTKWTIATSDNIDALLVPQRNAMAVAYSGFFPEDSSFPSDDDLRDEWQEALDAKDAQAFLATLGESNRPIGVVTTSHNLDFDEGEIEKLYVEPDWWGKGLGAELLATAEKRLRARGYASAGLWVLEANQPARMFYVKRGWTLVEGVTQAPFRSPMVRYQLSF